MPAALETRSDCSRCAALCCIAYPSADMPGFSASKQAGEACPKLASDGLCTIYANREAEGFAGCIRYECFGAGQHVVQELFGGRDWRSEPDLLAQMVETFLAMRPVSDLAYLADRAAQIALPDGASATLAAIGADLAEIASSRDTLSDTKRIGEIERAVRRIYAAIDPAKLRNK